MKKPVNKGGRPPLGDKAANKSLGGVRVTVEQLTSYGDAANAKGVSRADWIRETLDRAAARILK